MAMWEPVGSMRCRSNSGSGGEDGRKIIYCVDGRQPGIHEVWTSAEDSVTHEVHLTARVDAGAESVGLFSTDYLTTTWRRVPMFGKNSINGSVNWLIVPDFLRNYGPP